MPAQAVRGQYAPNLGEDAHERLGRDVLQHEVRVGDIDRAVRQARVAGVGGGVIDDAGAIE